MKTAPTDVAAEGPEGGHERDGFVRRFDMNGNGTVELAELPPEMQGRMGKADQNGDGIIAKEELKAFREAHHKEMMEKADTDKDGKLDPVEAKAFHEARGRELFKLADKDGNGALTPEEAGDRWAHLSVADADKNGSVTEAEIDLARANGTLEFEPPMHKGSGHRGFGRHR